MHIHWRNLQTKNSYAHKSVHNGRNESPISQCLWFTTRFVFSPSRRFFSSRVHVGTNAATFQPAVAKRVSSIRNYWVIFRFSDFFRIRTTPFSFHKKRAESSGGWDLYERICSDPQTIYLINVTLIRVFDENGMLAPLGSRGSVSAANRNGIRCNAVMYE